VRPGCRKRGSRYLSGFVSIFEKPSEIEPTDVGCYLLNGLT
jgi:hypothetical protein